MLASGTISSLNYASKINGITVAIIGTSVGTVLFPRMSEFAANNDYEALKSDLMKGMKTLLPLLLPLTVGIMVLATPITRLLFERGEFNPNDTLRTSECLFMYSLGLLSTNLSQLVTRAFYSMKRAKLPAIISGVSLAVGIILNLLLIKPLQHRGIAFATSVSTTLGFILLMFYLRRTIGTLGIRKNLAEYIKIIVASIIMGIVIWGGIKLTPILDGSYSQCLIWTALLTGAGIIVYGSILFITRADIVTLAMKRFKRR